MNPRTILPVAVIALLLAAACTARTLPTRVATAVVAATQAQSSATADASATPTSRVAPTRVTSTPAPPAPTPLPTETPRPPTATPCASPSQVVMDTVASVAAGGALNVRVYLPPCYGSDARAYPVLYLFAGNIHDETKWTELGAVEAADTLYAEGAAPFLIVMSDGGWLANNTSGGPGSYESFVLDDLIPHVEANYCAWKDPRGRAIGGLSRGGYWALEIAFRFPALFVSAGGHSAALLDQFAGPAINPQITGLSNDLGELRIYLDIGSDDYLRTNTVRLHEDMVAAGIPHFWTLNRGRHEDSYWAEHVDDYLAWYAAAWSSARDEYPSCTITATPAS